MSRRELLAFRSAVVLGLLGCLAPAGRAPAQDRADHAVAAKRLHSAVEHAYSYRDRLGIDWAKRFDEYEPKLAAATDKAEFARVTVELLGAAKDGHVFLKDGQLTIPTHQPNLTPNINPRVLPKLIPQLKQHGKTVLVGSWPDGVRYVAIATWDHRDPAAMKEAIAAVRAAAKAKAPLVLDARPNTGGDEVQAREVAGLFVTKPTPYAKHVKRSKGKDSPQQQRVLNPDPQGLHHPGPCVVLMGPANFSSCEAFLMMMRAAGQPLIGAKSAGSSGNPQPHDLGNGLVVMLSSWRSLDLDGRELEGVGITPDVVVDAGPGDFATADPVLAKALEHLRARGKP